MQRDATEALLARLEDVRERGGGAYMARCPAHDDRTPSLSITARDGRVLAFCFGCGASGVDVVHALGLEVADLFDAPALEAEGRRPRKHSPGAHPHAASAALRTLADDALLVAVAAEAVAGGEVLDDETRHALFSAARRCRTAEEKAHGRT